MSNNPNPNPNPNKEPQAQAGQASQTKTKKIKKKYLASYRDKELGRYAESIIVRGKSKYASVDLADREVRLIDYVDYLGGRFYPPSVDDYDNRITTYIFRDEKEFDDVLERAKHETLETLYQRVLTQWKRYSCAGKYENELCAAWTIYTYYEDVFGITFYIFFIGTPDSGKTNKLRIINKLAYRNLMSTSMTASNVYRHLGSYQECQGTICEDEADMMDEDIEKMKIYKNGYTKGVRVRRNDKEGGSKYSGNWYCTFGSKAFGSENSIESLGLKSRAVEMKSIADIPDWDITDVINETGDEELEALHKELDNLRKLLFCYKLIHCHQKYRNIELSINNREAQLFKPLLRLFYDTDKTQKKLFKITSYFVNQRRVDSNQNLLSLLYTICDDMVDNVGIGSIKNLITIATVDIWDKYVLASEAKEITALTCESPEFGKKSRQEITKLIKDNFKAEPPKHTGERRELVFSRRIMKRLARKYKLEDVEVKEITREERQKLRREWQESNRVFRDENEDDNDESEDDNSSITKVESVESVESLSGRKENSTEGHSEHENPRSNEVNHDYLSSQRPSQASQASQTEDQDQGQDDDGDGGHSERVGARYQDGNN